MKKVEEYKPTLGGKSALAYARLTFNLTRQPVPYLGPDGEELLYCGDDTSAVIDADVIEIDLTPQLPAGPKSGKN